MKENRVQETTRRVQSLYTRSIDKDIIVDYNFYYKFLEENNLLQVEIVSFEIVGGEGYFFNQYVNFSVKVITDHISFITKRRYRQFHELYLRINKYHEFVIKFPQKTRISSKITSELSISRMSSLNNFILEILSLPKGQNQLLLIQFLEFFRIKEQYQLHNILYKVNHNMESKHQPTSLVQESQLTVSYCISHEMLKLNTRKEDSLKYLANIEQIILSNNKKSKLKFEDLREVLLGNTSITGLIQLALGTDNELVAICFLKTLHKFFSLEQCSYSEACKKILQTLPARLLKLNRNQDNSNIFESNQFLFLYFKLVQLYFELRLTNNQKLPIKTLIKDIIISQRVMDRYDEWKKINHQNTQIRKRVRSQLITATRSSIKSKSQSHLPRKTHLDVGVISNISQIYYKNIPSQQATVLVDQSNEYRVIHSEKNFRFEVSNDLKILHLQIRLNLPVDEVSEQFKQWKYNKIILGCYKVRNTNDIWSLEIKAPNRQHKIFKLRQKYPIKDIQSQQTTQPQTKTNPKQSTQTIGTQVSNQTNKSYNICFEPIEPNDSHGFEYSMIIKQTSENIVTVDIHYTFIKNEVRKYFGSELQGKTKIIYQGIHNIINKYKAEEKIIEFDQLQPISEKESLEVDEFV